MGTARDIVTATFPRLGTEYSGGAANMKQYVWVEETDRRESIVE